MTVPKVSVGMPVFNGENYLRLSIESLLNQSFEDFELIISDNASTDSTSEICLNYACMDQRIRYFRNESNIGSAPNYEKTFHLSRGQLFKWHAHDDLLKSNFLECCVTTIDMSGIDMSGSSTVLVYPHCDLIDETGCIIGSATEHIQTKSDKPNKRIVSIIRNVSYGSALNGLIRSSILKRTQLSRSAAYWDLALLLELALFGKIIEIPEVLMQQRSHKGNALSLSSIKQGDKSCNTPAQAKYKARKDLLVWENPENIKKTVILPYWEEQCWQFFQRIYGAPLSKYEKMICWSTLFLHWFTRRLRTLGGKWKKQIFFINRF